MYCTHCGSQILPELKFCTNCGASTVFKTNDISKVKNTENVCQTCGKSFLHNQKFCTNCGATNLKFIENAPPGSSPSNENKIKEEPLNIKEHDVEHESYQLKSKKTNFPNKSKLKRTIIFIFIFFGLILIGFATWFVVNYYKDYQYSTAYSKASSLATTIDMNYFLGAWSKMDSNQPLDVRMLEFTLLSNDTVSSEPVYGKEKTNYYIQEKGGLKKKEDYAELVWKKHSYICKVSYGNNVYFILTSRRTWFPKDVIVPNDTSYNKTDTMYVMPEFNQFTTNINNIIRNEKTDNTIFKKIKTFSQINPISPFGSVELNNLKRNLVGIWITNYSSGNKQLRFFENGSHISFTGNFSPFFTSDTNTRNYIEFRNKNIYSCVEDPNSSINCELLIITPYNSIDFNDELFYRASEDTVLFYLALEKADSAFKSEDYGFAKKYYIKASEYQPNNNYIINQIDIIKTKLINPKIVNQEISHPRVIKETVPKKINISLHNNQIAWNTAGVGYTYVVTITEHDNNKVIHKFPDFDKTAIELPIELLQTNRLYNISVKWKKASAEGPIENKSFSLIDNGNKINPECIK